MRDKEGQGDIEGGVEKERGTKGGREETGGHRDRYLDLQQTENVEI